MCITNRHLCRGDFLEQVKRIANAKPDGIILREKDLQKEEYEKDLQLFHDYVVLLTEYNGRKR